MSTQGATLKLAQDGGVDAGRTFPVDHPTLGQAPLQWRQRWPGLDGNDGATPSIPRPIPVPVERPAPNPIYDERWRDPLDELERSSSQWPHPRGQSSAMTDGQQVSCALPPRVTPGGQRSLKTWCMPHVRSPRDGDLRGQGTPCEESTHSNAARSLPVLGAAPCCPASPEGTLDPVAS